MLLRLISIAAISALSLLQSCKTLGPDSETFANDGAYTSNHEFVVMVRVMANGQALSCAAAFLSSSTALTSRNCAEYGDLEYNGVRAKTKMSHPNKDLTLIGFDPQARVYRGNDLPRLKNTPVDTNTTVMIFGFASVGNGMECNETSTGSCVRSGRGQEVLAIRGSSNGYYSVERPAGSKQLADGDLGGAWITRDGNQDQLVAVTTEDNGRFVGISLADANVLNWLTDQAKSSSFDIPDLEGKSTQAPTVTPSTSPTPIAKNTSNAQCQCLAYQDAGGWFCGWKCSGVNSGRIRFGPLTEYPTSCESSWCGNQLSTAENLPPAMKKPSQTQTPVGGPVVKCTCVNTGSVCKLRRSDNSQEFQLGTPTDGSCAKTCYQRQGEFACKI